MQKQAKIDFSDPKVKKIVWNLKHFNKEYKTAYNAFLSTLLCGVFIPILGLIFMWVDDIEWYLWIPLCCVGIACVSAFFAGCSAQKRLKENGYDGHYDPIFSEFAKLRIRAFLLAAITLIGIVIWGIYGTTVVEDYHVAMRMYRSTDKGRYLSDAISSEDWLTALAVIGAFWSEFSSLFLSFPIGRIRKQLTLEALASESENAPTEQIVETEQPRAEMEQPQPQAENPQAEAPQSAQLNFCTACGNRITDPEALFCERCGRRLK